MESFPRTYFMYNDVPKVADDRICPVCGEEAPDAQVHHPHYGGICCYSCRAFFRRASRKSKSLVCKTGNKNSQCFPWQVSFIRIIPKQLKPG